jgi:RNA polymerase sigma-70 factor (ECF subfamily)
VFATFVEFFHADFPCLIGFLINLGYSEDVAKDAATDAMVIAYREWSSLESPRAWVRKVARNQAEKLRRGEARGAQIILKMAAADLRPVADDDPERHWLLSEEDRWVARALACLAPHRRWVMALHLDGFSTAEIARVTGIKENTVRSHLRHAREQLSRNLKLRTRG